MSFISDVLNSFADTADSVVPQVLGPAATALGGFVGGPAGAAVGSGFGNLAQRGDLNSATIAGGTAYGTSGGFDGWDAPANGESLLRNPAQASIPQRFGDTTFAPSYTSYPGALGAAPGAWSMNPYDFLQQAGGSYSGYTGPDSAISPGGYDVGGSYAGSFGGEGVTSSPLASMLNWARQTGAQPWGSPSNLISLGTAGYGLLQSQKLQKMAELARTQADPWGVSGGRAQAGGNLQALLANPNSVTSLPGYQAGLQAVQRSMAAQGYNGSGNMMAALQKYGGDFYNNAVNQLGGLAGANVNPGTAANIGMSGATAGANLALNSLGLLGKTATMAAGAR